MINESHIHGFYFISNLTLTCVCVWVKGISYYIEFFFQISYSIEEHKKTYNNVLRLRSFPFKIFWKIVRKIMMKWRDKFRRLQASSYWTNCVEISHTWIFHAVVGIFISSYILCSSTSNHNDFIWGHIKNVVIQYHREIVYKNYNRW